MNAASAHQFPTDTVDSIPVNLASNIRDDLTIIKGIGPVRQQWLRESLQICTFRDLAAHSSHEIASQLKAAGQIASHKKIDHWVLEAQRLATAAQTQKSGSHTVQPASTTEGKQSSGGDGWRPIASFVVEFKERTVAGQHEQHIKVHHIEADTCAHWLGIEEKQLSSWMLARVADRVAHDSSEKV